MVKLSIEARYGTARFAVSVQARSTQRALNTIAARHPGSVARVKLKERGDVQVTLTHRRPLEAYLSRAVG